MTKLAMLIHGGFPQCNSNTLHPNLISHPLLVPNKTHVSFSSNRDTHLKILHIHAKIRTGFQIFASKIPGKGEISRVLEMDEFEPFDDEDVFEDEFEEEGEQLEDIDEDEEVVIPLRNMRQWIENKPRGFGEGKVYDTTIEDKLFDEIEQSRLAQLANLNKLKNSSEEISSKKVKEQKQKVSEAVPNGIRVRLVNLPKKKNIYRDLQAAFKGVPGIINISPAVSGNKKTREPVCKGFGFVYFKSQNEADRFVQIFSRQSISFGKIQKQVSCEIVDSSSKNPDKEQLADRTDYALPIVDSVSEDNLNPEFEARDTSFDSFEETTFDESKGSGADNVSTLKENTEESVESFSLLATDGGDGTEYGKESASNSESLKNETKIRKKGKQVVAKTKEWQTTKLNIPGSANRLKMKDKSLLSGVFSKYRAGASMAAKEDS